MDVKCRQISRALVGGEFTQLLMFRVENFFHVHVFIDICKRKVYKRVRVDDSQSQSTYLCVCVCVCGKRWTLDDKN